jgi:hypothetical protein
MARLRATRPLTLQRKIAARSTNCVEAVGPQYDQSKVWRDLAGAAPASVLPQKPLMRLGAVTGKVVFAAVKHHAGPTPEIAN